MLHACVRTFDVTGTVEFFLETKQGLRISSSIKFIDKSVDIYDTK